LDLARRECLILKKLNHKNIVRLIEVIDDPQNNKMFFVMEYVEYGPVWKQEEAISFTEEVARKYILDILEGLSYRLFYFCLKKFTKKILFTETLNLKIYFWTTMML
jgi:serine/threonine protein kinase